MKQNTAPTPVATPCRNDQKNQPQVPSHGKSQVAPTATTPSPPPRATPSTQASQPSPAVQSPVPGKLLLSEAAVDARMRRVMEVSKRTGKRKVSDYIFNQWQNKGKGRENIMKLFETCGYNKAIIAKPNVLLRCFSTLGVSF